MAISVALRRRINAMIYVNFSLFSNKIICTICRNTRLYNAKGKTITNSRVRAANERKQTQSPTYSVNHTTSRPNDNACNLHTCFKMRIAAPSNAHI